MNWYEVLKAFEEHKKGAKIELDGEDAETAKLVKAGFILETDDPESKGLADATEKLTVAIEKAVTKAIDSATATMAKRKNPLGRIDVGDDLELDDPCEGYGSRKEAVAGLFLKDLYRSQSGGQKVERLEKYKELKGKRLQKMTADTKAPTGITTVVGEEGGVLVPEVIGDTVFEKLFDDNSRSLASRVDRRPTSGQTVVNLRLKQDSAAEADRFGGVRVYTRNEAQQFTASKPLWEKDRTELEQLTAYVPFTDEMIEDSPVAIQSWLGKMVPEAIDWKLVKLIFGGTGHAELLGILNSPALLQIAKETGQAADTFVVENLDKMIVAMPVNLQSGAEFWYNPFMEPELRRLHYSQKVKNVAGSENVGGYGFGDRVFIPAGQMGNATAMLHGRPAYPFEHCKELGDVGDILYANPSQYQLAVKGGITSAISMHVRFDYGESVIRWVLRVGGQPHWKKALVPENGPSGAKISPFIAVAVRG